MQVGVILSTSAFLQRRGGALTSYLNKRIQGILNPHQQYVAVLLTLFQTKLGLINNYINTEDTLVKSTIFGLSTYSLAFDFLSTCLIRLNKNLFFLLSINKDVQVCLFESMPRIKFLIEKRQVRLSH